MNSIYRFAKVLCALAALMVGILSAALPARADWWGSGTGINFGDDYYAAARASLLNNYGGWGLIQDGIDTKFVYDDVGQAVQFQDCGTFSLHPSILCGLAVQDCPLWSGEVATAGGCVTSPGSYQGNTRCSRPCNLTGDPMNVLSGNLYETVTDFKTEGADPLTAIRYYNSSAVYLSSGMIIEKSRFGRGWRSEYDMSLWVDPWGDVDIILPDGNPIRYYKVGSVYKQMYYDSLAGWVAGRTDVDVRLTKSGSQWLGKIRTIRSTSTTPRDGCCRSRTATDTKEPWHTMAPVKTPS